MNRICPRCHKVYSYADKVCPNGCDLKDKYERNKVYDKCQRKNHDFYNSKEWKFLREACKNKFSGLCIWNYYIRKRIVKGTVAHHILPLATHKAHGLSLDNLIYVSEEAHREIHTKYTNVTKEEYERMIPLERDKLNEDIQDLLFKLRDKWEEQDKGVGV